jgi:uncharacterized protein
LVRVRATPNAAKDTIEGLDEDASTGSSPGQGSANAALEALLAVAVGLPKAAVSVEKGETQRIKTVRISSDASIGAALEALTGERDAG